ncbi:MAG TPA: Bax inhibitor-1 family protein [Casimicrobiaceae bacterium]
MQTKFEPVMSSSTTLPRNPAAQPSTPVDRHRVMRNTYALLALSLLPTIGGAWVGMQFNFFAAFRAHPIGTPLLMFGAMMAAAFAVTRLRNSSWGVAALLGFTFIAGVFLTPILTVAAGFRNGGVLIGEAAGMTAAIFFAMAAVATFSKKDFSFLGNFLGVGLLLLIVAMLANLFFQVPAASLALSGVAVLLFSGFVLYDLSNIVNGGETNYVVATLQIYLNLYNIFVSLLNLLMAFSGQRD